MLREFICCKMERKQQDSVPHKTHVFHFSHEKSGCLSKDERIQPGISNIQNMISFSYLRVIMVHPAVQLVQQCFTDFTSAI